ncbi:MAG: tRNA preQ1(34) S-adenosylmethionine ribosyltransferase-isomerase QueA [Opitutus sp.]
MIPLSTALFDYHLPEHLIAQKPAERRDESRLLVVDRQSGKIAHHRFTELPSFLRSGDTLFRNNAAVLPARLRALRPTGGNVECFLLSPASEENVWRCLMRPGKKLPVGAIFHHKDHAFGGRILEKFDDGSALVGFTTTSGDSITKVANQFGEVPLPPYIRRTPGCDPDHSERARDLERYQTVYANPSRQVAVAAPTAGLHFTPNVLEHIARIGVTTADVTLHVGLGTFKPITVEHIPDHIIHRELYEMPPTTQAALLSQQSGRRVAVGTTTVRTIEDFLSRNPSQASSTPYMAEASIFIYPPCTFLGIDALITNFHQPRSTLLCLVAAFLTPGSTDGIDWLKEIYRSAIDHEYRFFSYGDAMLIL